MNKVILIGRLTRDPDITVTANDISVCKFTLAVERKFTNASGEKEVDFINIVAWRGLADNCGKYLRKGSKAAVAGSMRNRTYEDRDGNNRTVTEVLAEDVEFLTPLGSRDEQPQEQAPGRRVSELTPIDGDDLPF